MYGVAKEMANILQPLVGGSPHHIRNTQLFVKEAKSIQIQWGGSHVFLQYKGPLHCSSGGPCTKYHTKKLQWETTLQNRSPLSIPNIMSLLRFCLKRTFFTIQGKSYRQVKVAAMGSPLTPVVANLILEDFKTRALCSLPHLPRIWLRFVDTFVIHRAEHTQQFLTHLNFLDPNIQFITESPDQQGFLPFLDTLTSQGLDGNLITTVYRKPTYTDQYLHWDSHHSITNEYCIYNTF